MSRRRVVVGALVLSLVGALRVVPALAEGSEWKRLGEVVCRERSATESINVEGGAAFSAVRVKVEALHRGGLRARLKVFLAEGEPYSAPELWLDPATNSGVVTLPKAGVIRRIELRYDHGGDQPRLQVWGMPVGKR